MRARRRLLVALPILGRAGDEVDGLRRALGSPALSRIGPHITLVPPVNMRDEDLPAVLALLRRAAEQDSYQVSIGPPATFAPRTPVVYLQVGSDGGRLAQLHRQLSVHPLAPPSGRPQREFVPHVTLSNRVEEEQIPAVLATLAGFRIKASLNMVLVYEQDPTSADHSWRALADVVLGLSTTVGRGGRELHFVTSSHPPPDSAWADEFAPPPLRREGHVAVAALEEGRVVGITNAQIERGRVEAFRLIVHPDHRGTGIGGLLLRRFETVSLSLHCSLVRFVLPPETTADRFFVEHGYRRLEASGDPLEPVIFERRLAPLPTG